MAGLAILLFIIYYFYNNYITDDSNNEKDYKTTYKSADTTFITDLEDQLAEIGIAQQYINSDKSIFEKCGVTNIMGANHINDIGDISVYTLDYENDFNLTIMIKSSSLFYLGITGIDLYTYNSGIVNSIDNINIPETAISNNTKEKLKSICIDEIKATAKYPETVEIYDKWWQFDRRDQSYTVFTMANQKNALGTTVETYYYIKLTNNGNEYIVDDIETLRDKIDRAYSVMGNTYGSKAEDYLSSVSTIYDKHEEGIFIDRQTELMKCFLSFGISSDFAYQYSHTLTQFSYTYANDLGFESQDIFERILSVYNNNDTDCLTVLGKDLSHDSLTKLASESGINVNIDKLSKNEKILLITVAILS